MDYKGKNFLDIAFTSAQKGGIVTSNLTNADSISYGTEGGNDTRDKVFLLSESEVSTDAVKSHGFVSYYGNNDEARRCMSTTYAMAMGAGAKYFRDI